MPVMIIERGQATVVLVRAAAFERAEHERAILKSLLRGEREIAAGRGHDLQDVLADVNDILQK
jgi:PHD/YefM family antitoxin component YafN of YafNO toxin-antitoxin module